MKSPLLRRHAAITAAVAGTLSAAALAAPYLAAARPSSLTHRVLLARDVPAPSGSRTRRRRSA